MASTGYDGGGGGPAATREAARCIARSATLLWAVVSSQSRGGHFREWAPRPLAATAAATLSNPPRTASPWRTRPTASIFGQHQRGTARPPPSPPASPSLVVAALVAFVAATLVPLVCVPPAPSPAREASPSPSPQRVPHPEPTAVLGVSTPASRAAAGPPAPPS